MIKIELEIDDKLFKELEIKNPDNAYFKMSINGNFYNIPIKKDDIIKVENKIFKIKTSINDIEMIGIENAI